MAWASRRAVDRAVADRDVRCLWHRTFSEELGPRWTLPIDLLLIDGDHSEAAVRRDWDEFSDHLRPGGHVVFHDAREHADGAGWPGPTAVVAALFGDDGIAPEAWKVVAEVRRTVVVQRQPETSRQA
jgi:hypothetical protein